MSDTETIVRPEARLKTEKPKLYKVILLNDDFTPREFVTMVLMSVFRMSVDEASGVMLSAHRNGACVVAVYTKEVAEMKAKEGSDLATEYGYPLAFTTEKES